MATYARSAEQHLIARDAFAQPDNDLARRAVDIAHKGHLEALFLDAALIDAHSVDPQHAVSKPVT
jgi:hypothetical protein